MNTRRTYQIIRNNFQSNGYLRWMWAEWFKEFDVEIDFSKPVVVRFQEICRDTVIKNYGFYTFDGKIQFFSFSESGRSMHRDAVA